MPPAYTLPDFLPSIATTLVDALAGAKIGFCVMFDDGKRHAIVYENEVAMELLGYALDEVVGRDSLFCIAPEEIAAVEERRLRALRGEAVPRTLDTIIVRKDGRRVPVEIGTSRVKIDGKEAVIAFMRDTSERVEAQAALRRSEERFRRLIEAVPEAIGVAKEGKLVYTNPALVRQLGYDSLDELVGRPMADFVVNEEVPLLAERVRAIARGGALAPHEYRIRKRDGSHATIEAYSIAIEFEGGPAVLGVSHDITEQKLHAQQLLHADRMAIVGTLAAGVAHEINNPLAYVALILERLRRELPLLPKEPSRVSELVTLIDEARGGADRVATIVRDLRLFSRDGDESVVLTDLRHVLESSIKMAENEIRHRARLVVEIGELPLIEASEARLGQVFLNLLVNAVQALPDGNPEKNEVRVIARAEEDALQVEISDTGAGIAPEIRARIFEPFFTTKAVGVGTGLGLSICHSIVSSLGGAISVDSAPGKGTTFRVTLPRARRRDEARAISSAPPSEKAGAETERSARILVVDDEVPLGTALQYELEDEYDVTLVTSGRAALEKILTDDYDVVLCDVMMPDLSGIDIHEEVARKRPGLEARMVFMTGGAFTPRARGFFERTDIRRIEKPFDRLEMRKVLRAAARRR